MRENKIIEPIVSLGCNCHPAYWLEKMGIRAQSMPFDWLLTRPHLGMQFVVEMIQTEFRGFTQGIYVNHRSHPVSALNPATEFFHHHDLLDPVKADTERERLNRRAARLLDKIKSSEQINFVYCYPLDEKSNKTELISQTYADAIKLKELIPHARLAIYFLSDDGDFKISSTVSAPPGINISNYTRDKSINPTWGGPPEFLQSIENFR